jgi:hypothetical protein
MYKCCITGKIVPRHTPANKVILEIQPVTYKIMYQGGISKRGRGPEGPRVLRYGKGWEIKREGLVSPQAMHKVPKLEDLIEGLAGQEPVERVNMLAKRPKKKGGYRKRSQGPVARLKIVKEEDVSARLKARTA